MPRATISSIDQKIDDVKGDLKDIKDHLKTLNGKVASNCLEINTLNVNQKNCPAREFHKVANKRDYQTWLVSLMTAVVVVILTKIVTKWWI